MPMELISHSSSDSPDISVSFIRPRLDCATQCSSRSTPSRAEGDLQRLAWRSDSCPGCEGASGEDLSGGYFEAGGSYLKFSYPLAFTITQLAWGVVEYRDGYAKAGRIPHLFSVFV